MSTTKIEWADMTINPVVGCSKISDGCKNCYAHKMFPRLKGMGTRLYKDMEDFSDIKWDLDILGLKLQALKKPQRIFLGSMTDLFHEKVPEEVIRKVLSICSLFPQHTILILTKRYVRLAQWIDDIMTPSNVNFGVSISNNNDLYNAYFSGFTVFGKRKIFVSFEPLLGKLNAEHGNILKAFIQKDVNWIIVGAETGNKRRNFEEDWALDILKVARLNDIPFFFKKQFKDGEWTNKLDGKEYLEFLEVK